MAVTMKTAGSVAALVAAFGAGMLGAGRSHQAGPGKLSSTVTLTKIEARWNEKTSTWDAFYCLKEHQKMLTADGGIVSSVVSGCADAVIASGADNLHATAVEAATKQVQR